MATRPNIVAVLTDDQGWADIGCHGQVTELPTRRRYGLAMLAAIDDGVGRVVACLQKHAILEQTLIVFTSDNGAPLKKTKPDLPIAQDDGGWDGSLNDPWVGEKGMLSEGGIRVPMVWSFPERLPQGTTYPHPVSSLDIAATVMQLTTAGVPAELDGIDVLPFLDGTRSEPPARSLFWRFWRQTAIRRGDWKLLQLGDDRSFLFDLSSDQHERENLIARHPDIAASLRSELAAWTNQLPPPPPAPARQSLQENGWYDFYFPEP